MGGDASNEEMTSVISGITKEEEVNGLFENDDGGRDIGERRPAFASSGKIFGREKERQVLQQVWERSSCDKPESQVVWVCGPSGVGKSFLLSSMRGHVRQQNDGIYVCSKFDQLAVAKREPFYAVVAALSDVCEIVSAEQQAKVGRVGVANIGDDLRKELGFDFSLFCQFVPTMKQLLLSSASRPGGLLDDSKYVDHDGKDDDCGVESMARLIRACSAFLSCISRHYPLFFALEDLQWADCDTIHLLQNLFRHSKDSKQRVSFVLTAREGDPATRTVAKSLGITNDGDDEGVCIQESSTSSLQSPPLTYIKVSNLTEEGVHELLCSLLGCMDDEVEIEALTKVVHAKTSGNPFFIVQYLEMLCTQEVLVYSEEEDRWGWDDDVLEKMARRDISDSVLKSIDARVYRLDPTTRSALMIAAHLGYKFRSDVLEAILPVSTMFHSRVPDEDNDHDTQEKRHHQRYVRIIDTAEKTSMLLRMKSRQNSELCFMHDRVQQCFYEMCPDENGAKERMYLNIARQLRPMVESRTDNDESLKFLCTDMWNRAGSTLITNKEERMFLVKLNQHVSEIARRKSSYSSASHYLRMAINLLDKTTMWTEKNYHLSLSLYSSFSQCTANSGETEECHDAVEVVLANATDELHKQAAYQARLHSLELQGKNEEVVRVGLAAMKELGHPLSSKPGLFSIIFQVMRNKSRLKKITDEALLSMPRITDKRQAAACDMIDAIGSSAFISAPNTFMRNGQRMLQVSLRDGISKFSPLAVAGFGLMEIVMFKNFQDAARWANVSIMMIDKYGLYEAECACLMISNFFALPFSRPWIESVEPLSRAFQCGLKYGKLHFGISSLGMTCPMLLVSKTLSEAEKAMRSIVSTQIQLLKTGIYKYWSQAYWQQVLNLMGASHHTVVLTGEAMQEHVYVVGIPDRVALASYRVRKLELACYFRSHRLALQYTKLLDSDESALDLMCPLIVSKHCFGGITYLAEAAARRERRGKTRSYVKKAKKSRKWLSTVVEKGCVDAKPYSLLLKATFSAFDRKKYSGDETSVQLNFDNAIQAAVDCGFMGMAAFACERAYYALKDTNDGGSFASYWNQALEYYTIWEAFGKVDQMHQRKHDEAEIFTLKSAPPSVVKVSQ